MCLKKHLLLTSCGFCVVECGVWSVEREARGFWLCFWLWWVMHRQYASSVAKKGGIEACLCALCKFEVWGYYSSLCSGLFFVGVLFWLL